MHCWSLNEIIEYLLNYSIWNKTNLIIWFRMGIWNRHNFLFWWSMFIIENSSVDRNLASIESLLILNLSYMICQNIVMVIFVSTTIECLTLPTVFQFVLNVRNYLHINDNYLCFIELKVMYDLYVNVACTLFCPF